MPGAPKKNIYRSECAVKNLYQYNLNETWKVQHRNENSLQNKPHKTGILKTINLYWNYKMESAGIEPASKHIATQISTFIGILLKFH